MANEPILIFDGDKQILFSQVFNVYSNILIIKPIFGFELTFEFITDKTKESFSLEFAQIDSPKKIHVKLYNFNQPLGVGTTALIPIIRLDDGKIVSFTIHTKSLNEQTSYLQVTLTFYLGNA